MATIPFSLRDCVADRVNDALVSARESMRYPAAIGIDSDHGELYARDTDLDCLRAAEALWPWRGRDPAVRRLWARAVFCFGAGEDAARDACFAICGELRIRGVGYGKRWREFLHRDRKRDLKAAFAGSPA